VAQAVREALADARIGATAIQLSAQMRVQVEQALRHLATQAAGQPDRSLASERAGGGASSQTRDEAGSRRDDYPGALHALPTEPPPA
jgi:hypothetical protein